MPGSQRAEDTGRDAAAPVEDDGARQGCRRHAGDLPQDRAVGVDDARIRDPRAYTFQWPIIGAFAVVIWNRYRKHGNLTKWFTERYRTRIEELQRESRDARPDAEADVDPDAVAWQEYLVDLRRQEREGAESRERDGRL